MPERDPQKAFALSMRPVVEDCVDLQRRVRGMTPKVGDLPDGTQFQEVNANMMLAVRNLEYAEYRLRVALGYAEEVHDDG